MKQIDVINHSSGCVVAGGYSSGRITFEKAIDDRWDLTKRVEEMLSAHDLIGRKPTCYSFVAWAIDQEEVSEPWQGQPPRSISQTLS